MIKCHCPLKNGDRTAKIKKTTTKSFSKDLAKRDASMHEQAWWKVVDDKTGAIMGGAFWLFMPNGVSSHNNDSNEDDGVAVWFPPGPERELATQCIRGLRAPYARTATGPHAYLKIAFTAPAHRRKGVARAFIGWGLRHADQLGLDVWLNVSEMSKPVYEQYDFVSWFTNDVRPVMPEGYSEEEKKQWKEKENQGLPLLFTMMWRPAGGNLKGRTKPWEMKKAN